MGTCIIFCAGVFDRLIRPIEKSDYIIAADGGLAHVKRLGLSPNEILGDFDSLGYTPEGSTVFPAEKDDTDAMLAVRKGLALGYQEFVLYGSIDGPRLDHTVANFQTLQFLADHEASGILVGRDWLITVVQEGNLSFPAGMEGHISLFCLGKSAQGVTIRGLYYPLENGELSPGFPLGVSNHFTREPVQIYVRSGSLLVMWERGHNPLPNIDRRQESC